MSPRAPVEEALERGQDVLFDIDWQGTQQLRDKVSKDFVSVFLLPPSVPELERSTGRRDLLAVLRLAAARGQVEAVERDRYYAREALDRFTTVLNDLGQQGEIIPGAVRERVGGTPR